MAGAAIALVWVAALSIAVRRLDATDRLAPAVAAASGTGAFALAAFGGQHAVAALAALVTIGCVAFLAIPRRHPRPASGFLGEPGSVLTGSLLGVVTIAVRPAIPAPGSLVVPLLLAGVPLLALAGATPHRVRGGLAVALLGLVQLGLSALAVFAGRGVVTPAAVGAVGLTGLLLTVPVMRGTRAHPALPKPRPRRRLRLAVLVFAGLVAAAALPGTVAAVLARGVMDDARADVEVALAAARDGDAEAAETKFGEAADRFGVAYDRLNGPLARVGLGVPVLGPNLRAARELAGAGADLALAGERLAARVEPERLSVVDGTVPIAEVRRVTPDLETGARLIRAVADEVEAIDDPYLLGPVEAAVSDLRDELGDAAREADRAAAGARLAPALLGGDGPRRYFLAVQNSAEARATGGFIGNWGILVAEHGKVRLERFERVSVLNQGAEPVPVTEAPEEFLARYGRFDPTHTWQNVNMSPDFPTVGSFIAGLYPQSGGEPVDGVVAVDPQGLAAILELTGPVAVADWPEPLTARNVVDVTLRGAYDRFAETPERAEFLGEVAREVVDIATRAELGEPARIAKVLGEAAHEGHLILSFVRPEEQALAVRLDAAGGIPPLRSDSLLVTTQNAAGNKLDYYLRRRFDYAVRLEPDASGRRARVSGTLRLGLDNTAPDQGLAPIVIGPYDERFVAGENRSFVSLYTPLRFTTATIDGEPAGLEAATELGRNVFSSFVSVLAHDSRALAVDLRGTVALTADGWYRLDVVRQPGLHPDEVRVAIEVPRGWRIAAAEGLDVAAGRATARMDLTKTTTVRIRVEPAERPMWDRLVDGP